MEKQAPHISRAIDSWLVCDQEERNAPHHYRQVHARYKSLKLIGSWCLTSVQRQRWPNIRHQVTANNHGEVLVSLCFKPSQPQRITSGLTETFIKRHMVERTNKARDRTGRTEWENGELSGEFMEWNKVERAIKTKIDTRTIIRSRQAQLVYTTDINRNISTTWRWARGDYVLKPQK